jgi:hypothetical protein
MSGGAWTKWNLVWSAIYQLIRTNSKSSLIGDDQVSDL